ncbi:hypothetical protein Anapl_05592 [Anas platyrhynchos]|uniref:Uncharacterized protein n=1 Tax=Anas platyrhynchos TaxID=8839 RepID=R0JZN7_ANAPL|nr:hypothetical protein Anapl_05592 [Anas platyrhynchos]
MASGLSGCHPLRQSWQRFKAAGISAQHKHMHSTHGIHIYILQPRSTLTADTSSCKRRQICMENVSTEDQHRFLIGQSNTNAPYLGHKSLQTFHFAERGERHGILPAVWVLDLDAPKSLAGMNQPLVRLPELHQRQHEHSHNRNADDQQLPPGKATYSPLRGGAGKCPVQQELCSPDQTPESLQTEGGLASRLLWFKVGEKTCTQTCCRHIFKGESDVQIPKSLHAALGGFPPPRTPPPFSSPAVQDRLQRERACRCRPALKGVSVTACSAKGDKAKHHLSSSKAQGLFLTRKTEEDAQQPRTTAILPPSISSQGAGSSGNTKPSYSVITLFLFGIPTKRIKCLIKSQHKLRLQAAFNLIFSNGLARKKSAELYLKVACHLQNDATRNTTAVMIDTCTEASSQWLLHNSQDLMIQQGGNLKGYPPYSRCGEGVMKSTEQKSHFSLSKLYELWKQGKSPAASTQSSSGASALNAPGTHPVQALDAVGEKTTTKTVKMGPDLAFLIGGRMLEMKGNATSVQSVAMSLSSSTPLLPKRGRMEQRYIGGQAHEKHVQTSVRIRSKVYPEFTEDEALYETGNTGELLPEVKHNQKCPVQGKPMEQQLLRASRTMTHPVPVPDILLFYLWPALVLC